MKQIRRNSKPFNEVCLQSFGREVIKTNADKITADNIIKELGKSLAAHNQNKEEIDYLFTFYCGNQPILYREKSIRPEICNRVVINTAYFIVETKVGDIASEPIQYVLRGTDEQKSDDIAYLNTLMDAEDKHYIDTCLARWRSICGTSYRFIANDSGQSSILDETDFRISVCDPRDTYVVYYRTGLPAYSVQISQDEKSKNVYYVYTNEEWFEIRSNKIERRGTNGFFAIPVIEYPNNENRISDIEITIAISDSINDIASSRQDGIDQFVSSFVKFVNCEMDAEKFRELRQSGAFVVKSNNGENKADVDIMSSELNQTQTQVAIDDLFDKMLVIQGIANREGSTGHETGKATEIRNGWIDSERRAETNEPIFKKAEKQFLRILLYTLSVKGKTSLQLSDIEIKISRSNMDNMLTKAETLQMLLSSGIYPERAIKSVGFFADPEQVAIESKERMDILYPTEKEEEPDETVEVVDEVV